MRRETTRAQRFTDDGYEGEITPHLTLTLTRRRITSRTFDVTL
jgi:hypothetical protein